MIGNEKKAGKQEKNERSRSRRSAHRALTAMLSLVLVLSLIGQAAAGTAARAASGRAAADFELYDGSAYATDAFATTSMLPGDGTELDANAAALQKSYCVRISHSGAIKLCFRTVVSEGDTDFKNGLSMKASYSLDGGTTETSLCDDSFGKLDGMEHIIDIPASNSGSTDIVFKLNPYLPTTAGNECQNKTLKASFEWYVKSSGSGGSSVKPTKPTDPTDPNEPTDPNDPSKPGDPGKNDGDGKQDGKDNNNGQSAATDKDTAHQDGKLTPKTGDSLSIALWAVTAVSALLLLLIFVRGRKEEAENEN